MTGGARAVRLEDPELLTGRARFVADLATPETVHVAFVRSPHAAARIRKVDVAAALAAPGRIAAVTAADLGAAARPLPVLFPHPDLGYPANAPPLAAEATRYLGEPVAAVVAGDRYAAEDLAELVAVEYEPLPAVVGIDGAVAAGAPLVHAEAPGNVAGVLRQRVGDPEAAFAAADRVVRAEFRIDRGSAQPMETRGVLARWDPEAGRLTVYVGTQAPHRTRNTLAAQLGLPPEAVRVIAPATGGAFGVKGNVYPEEVVVAWLAMRVGRPVLWVEDRREHFVATVHERSQIHRVEAAVDRDGRILAFRDRFWHDAGAYVPYGLAIPQNTLMHLLGPYRIPAVEIEGTAVFTHCTPTAAYRGAGRPQGVYVIERTLDRIACELGIDPVEVRRRNLIRPDALPYDTGLRAHGPGPVIYDSGDYPACLETAVEAIDLDGFRERQREQRRQGRLLGVGVACYVEGTSAPPFEGARVSVDADGTVTVATGAAAQGQGHRTTWAGICAEVFGVSPAAVKVVEGDSAAIERGIGTYASRSAALAGSAVFSGAIDVRRQALARAAEMLEISPGDVEWVDGAARVRGAPFRRVSLAEIAAAAGPGGLAHTAWTQTSQPAWACGCHAAVVEVDAATGMVRILRYVAVSDCGRMLQPAIVDGQLRGAVAQGLGGSLYERLVYDESGQLLTATFMDYLLPAATEVPAVSVRHLESPSPLNALGAKGAGEGGALPAYAVIAQAVEDALAPFGVTVSALPLTPEFIQGAVARGPVSGAAH